MHKVRRLSLLLIALSAVLLSGAAVALATGPSAGDNQYTDPLANSTTSASAPTTTGDSGNSSPQPNAGTTTGDSGSGSTTPTTTDPTSTISRGKARQLPYTGLDAWFAAALGALLAGGGLVLRRTAAWS